MVLLHLLPFHARRVPSPLVAVTDVATVGDGASTLTARHGGFGHAVEEAVVVVFVVSAVGGEVDVVDPDCK